MDHTSCIFIIYDFLTQTVVLGIIFSIDTLRRSFQNQADNKTLLVATAAEDRSVVIWENTVVSSCELCPENYRAWCPLWILAATNPSNNQVWFAARIWCVRLCNWGLVASGEASGGGDGAVALTTFRFGRLNTTGINVEGEQRRKISKLISLGRMKGWPSIDSSYASPLSLSADPKAGIIRADLQPSIEQQKLIEEDSNSRNAVKQLSSKPRTVFIGPNGRIYCILESGHLLNTKSSSSEDNLSFNLTLARVTDSRQIFTQHPNSPLPPANIVEALCDKQSNLRTDLLFAGYYVVGLSENRTLLALGGRWGTVAVFRFTDSGHLTCLTVFALPTRNKIMSLTWLSDHPETFSRFALLIGVFPLETFIVNITLNAALDGAVLGKFISLVRPPSEEGLQSDLAWTSCGNVVQHVRGEVDRRATYLLCGSRAGGLYLYKQVGLAVNILRILCLHL
ncbi:unnamed protein product [Schistocephalus solidus]|uniref:WD_REPEATS_REGION domain-containing protein n=1 Tax=Schistocephalus solidus TaxID=70667 RepID=A0A183T992_SCHSO|nr:unnamed protein product [Schistocephalus solidus]